MFRECGSLSGFFVASLAAILPFSVRENGAGTNHECLQPRNSRCLRALAIQLHPRSSPAKRQSTPALNVFGRCVWAKFPPISLMAGFYTFQASIGKYGKQGRDQLGPGVRDPRGRCTWRPLAGGVFCRGHRLYVPRVCRDLGPRAPKSRAQRSFCLAIAQRLAVGFIHDRSKRS